MAKIQFPSAGSGNSDKGDGSIAPIESNGSSVEDSSVGSNGGATVGDGSVGSSSTTVSGSSSVRSKGKIQLPSFSDSKAAASVTPVGGGDSKEYGGSKDEVGEGPSTVSSAVSTGVDSMGSIAVGGGDVDSAVVLDDASIEDSGDDDVVDKSLSDVVESGVEPSGSSVGSIAVDGSVGVDDESLGGSVSSVVGGGVGSDLVADSELDGSGSSVDFVGDGGLNRSVSDSVEGVDKSVDGFGSGVGLSAVAPVVPPILKLGGGSRKSVSSVVSGENGSDSSEVAATVSLSGEDVSSSVSAVVGGSGRVDFDDFVDVDLSEDDDSVLLSDADVVGESAGLDEFLVNDVEVANPFFDDDSESVGGPVRVSSVVVPDAPVVPVEVERNVERRELRRAKSRGERRGAVDSSRDELGLKRVEKSAAKPLVESVVTEVVVDSLGVERGPKSSSKTGIQSASRVARGVSDGGSERVEQVDVRAPDGGEKWDVRSPVGGGQGKLGDDSLALFTNLSRGKSSRVAREELREIFARVDDLDHVSDEAKAKKKTLINRAVFGEEALRSGSRRRFTEKDRDTLRFIGLFKYANARHIARIFQITEKAMLKRLRALESQGFLHRKEVFGARELWYLSENGLIVSGVDVPRVKDSGITWTMLPHAFVVNHTAGNLWGGGVNVLNLDDFPAKNRVNEKGEAVFGEVVVSEYQIQSGFAKIKQTHKSDLYRPMVTGERDRQFASWKRAGGAGFGPSPELVEGNEFMWTLVPPLALRLAYHVPDLVLSRPRNGDGSPESVAVEVELANKPYQSYERALEAYRYDSVMDTRLYKKVVWVVKSRGAARKLEEAGEKLGLFDDDRLDIVPIFTEDGVFKGKAEWTI